ncbi:MAG: NADP-dependent phosphogluconate dehydrogenase [Geminicoccaceae bacterium]
MAVSIGLMGLGVIGQALALNIAGRGFAVHGYDPSEAARARAQGAGLPVFADVAALVASLPRPRQIMLSVPAGEPVDAAIASLRPLLTPGDLIADLGNSHYRETVRRGETLTVAGLHFLGIGVSGGEAGARSGPAIMAGGPPAAWARLGPALEAAAARYQGEPCCALVGPGGAGHFVKMVHNGIEYAVMQLIAETYDLANRGLGMDDGAIGALFTRWNDGPLASYLVQSTGRILALRDERTGGPLLDSIDDAAGQKGTGAWASMAALELGVPATLLATAVFARGLSADKRDRAALLPVFGGTPAGTAQGLTADSLLQALTCGVLAAYAQGFDLIRAGSDAQGWQVERVTVARIWRAGCIIRSAFLGPIAEAFGRLPPDATLLSDGVIAGRVKPALPGLRAAVAGGASAGVPTPCLGAALAMLDSAASARLPTRLIQAQRDFFGRHGFRRTDAEGTFHLAAGSGQDA